MTGSLTRAAFDAFLAEALAAQVKADDWWCCVPLHPTVYQAFVAARGRAPVDFDELRACPERVEAIDALAARRALEESND